MRVIEQKGEHSFVFSRYLDPVAHVKPGEVVEILTEDTFKGLVTSEQESPEKCLENAIDLNPQTGPLYIEGAEPGDTLAVHILDIIPRYDWGVSCIQKPLGGLTGDKFTRILNDPLPEKTWIYQYDAGTKTWSHNGDPNLTFTYEPFLGTIATAGRLEAISTLTPYENGGNMDTPDTCIGNTVYLPVDVEGAYFFTGDVHAKQGQGELCGTAIEIAARVQLSFDLIKGKRIRWPRIESPEELMVAGSARPMECAARIACYELIEWMAEYGWDRMDAYEALSLDGRLYCANMVDTNYTMVAKASKKLVMRQK